MKAAGVGGLLLLCPLFLPANVQKLYEQHCAVCHGEKGEGGLGSSLVDGIWTHGKTDGDHARVISGGLPDFGMQGFDRVLNEKEIRSLVIYLRELEVRANGPAAPVSESGVVQTQHLNYRLEVLLENDQKMWGVSFLPDGRRILTEIDGAVRILEKDGRLGPPVQGIPESVRKGQGGMLDVAVHPQAAVNGWIYLAFAEGSKDRCLTTVVRGRIRENTWRDQEVIFRAAEEFRSGGGVHFGSRIVFRDGYVYFSIGDRGAQKHAQDLNRPNGKIFRLHDDGRLPADNPFTDGKGMPEIWSYGHRNPQALSFRPGTQELWSTEHGPRGGDELNKIEAGKNYGWPVVTHGMNYNGTPITEHTSLPGMEDPVCHWTPSIATCGMAFADKGMYPDWEGDLLAGGLRAQVIERLRIGPAGVEEREVILKNRGRVRDIKTGPDGFLYVILEDSGSRLVRLRPVK